MLFSVAVRPTLTVQVLLIVVVLVFVIRMLPTWASYGHGMHGATRTKKTEGGQQEEDKKLLNLRLPFCTCATATLFTDERWPGTTAGMGQL
eukprot:3765628-Amphidinium_carterae.2